MKIMKKNNSGKRVFRYDEIRNKKIHMDCVTKLNNWLLMNKFNTINAEDIVQEAICRILERLSHEDIYLTCSCATYIMSFCKNIVLEESRGEIKRMTAEQQYYLNNYHERFGSIFSAEDRQYRQKQEFISLIRHLNAKGKELMTMLFEDVSTDQIFIRLGFKNAQAMADKKKNCLKRLWCLTKKGKIRGDLWDEVFETN